MKILVARVGGEEFMAILPDTNHKQAMVVAERMRFQLAQIANLPVSNNRLYWSRLLSS